MSRKVLLVVELLLVLIGGLAMQACFEEHTYRSAPYPPATSYGPYGVYSYGDYDQDRHWHDSDWWVDNDRDWVQRHHPNWITARKHHDNDRGHDHDEGHGQNYGHDIH